MTVDYLTGFSSTQRFETANLTGPLANTTGFSVFAVVLPNQSTSNQIIFGKTTGVSGTTGWGLSSSSAGYFLQVGDGSTSKTSPAFGSALAEVDKIQIIHGVIRSGVMYTYKNGVLVDGSTAISAIGSYTGPLKIGAFLGGTQFQSGIIAVGICSATGLSDAQVESHYQALLSSITATPTGADYHWVAADAGATWVDRISGLSAARTGTIAPASADYSFFSRFRAADYSSDTEPLRPNLGNFVGNLKVLPTGDSRTVGAGGTGSLAWRNGVTVLCEATVDFDEVDFVGPETSTSTDPQHNSFSGSDNRDHLNATNSVTNLPSAIMTTYNPSIIIHWLGVNGTGDDAEVVEEKAAYLDLIRAYHDEDQTVRFVLLEEATVSEAVRNARLEEMRYWQWNTAWPLLESEGIRMIKLKNPLLPSSGHYADTLHPNDTGYAALAAVIYPALRLAAGIDVTIKTVSLTKLTGVTKITW